MQTHLTSYTAHDEENLQQTTRVNTTKTSRAQVHSCSQTDTEKKLHDIKHFLLCSFKSKVKLNLSGLKQSSKNVQACFQKPSQQRHLMVKAANLNPSDRPADSPEADAKQPGMWGDQMVL